MTPITHDITYHVSPPLSNEILNPLFESAWPNRVSWDYGPVLARSLVYIAAYAEDTLVGFVNVAWDGGVHVFLLDTTVHPRWQRRGVGKELVRRAAQAARAKEGELEWLHADFDEPHLEPFYRACGFEPTHAGLIRLS